MNTAKSFKITIFGENYSLMSDETEEHVHSVAQQIDSLMKEVAHKMPQAPVEKIAVLVALQLASQLDHAKSLNSRYEMSHESLIEKINQDLHTIDSLQL